MQTAWIAGGAGFIGSHLCQSLVNSYNIVCIDNLITGFEANILSLKTNPNFQFINQDVIYLSDQEVSKLPKPDFIFHLASPASPNQKNKKSYISLPIETLLVNSIGTYNLIEIARRTTARFLFASTSEIYGDPLISPQSEKYFGNVNPIGIRSVYDESKRYGEAMTMAYVRKFNLNGKIARIFNTYGPKMQIDDGRVVSNFITQALSGSALTIYGNGKQTRSFCYVSDLVEGLTKLMFLDLQPGVVVNLGNPNEQSIESFAHTIKKMIPTSGEVTHENMPIDDPKRRKPDITLAQNLLGWTPKIPLAEGLEKTIQYFKQVL